MSHIDRTRPSVSERVLGGSPSGVLVRLLIMSFLVGIILRVLNVDVNDVMNWLDQRVRELSALGFDSIGELFSIVLVGAVIVVPVWLLMRVMKIISR